VKPVGLVDEIARRGVGGHGGIVTFAPDAVLRQD
jgi:hypothetical protein